MQENVAERSSEALRRHAQAIEATKEDAAGDDAPGRSQDHLKSGPPTPKIQSIEEARRILKNFGMTEAVRQKDKEKQKNRMSRRR